MADLASVQADFEAALAFVAKPPASVVRHVDNEEKLLFYGLFKQATAVSPPPGSGLALRTSRLPGHALVAVNAAASEAGVVLRDIASTRRLSSRSLVNSRLLRPPCNPFL